MMMFRPIAPAINLYNSRKNYSSGFLLSLYLSSLTSGYLWFSSFTVYAVNENSEIENTELRALLISGFPSRVRKGRSCKVEILICA